MAKKIYDRVTFVLYGADAWRVNVDVNEDGEVIVRIDLHGKKCAEALKLLKQIITIIQVPFILDVIHGYNHGTAIKEMIWNQLQHERVQDRYCNEWNPGETFICLT